MGRSRLLRPSFFKNEDLSDLGAECQLLFAGLWTLVDKQGVMEYRPRRIKAEVIPYREVDIEAMVEKLIKEKFLITYTVADQKYLCVTNFVKHQSPHHTEKDSGFPPPPKSAVPPAQPGRGEKPKAEKPVPPAVIPKSLQTQDFKISWARWVEYRKTDKKKPLSERNKNNQLLMLEKLGPLRAVDCLEISMSNNWEGLFPEKLAERHRESNEKPLSQSIKEANFE